jgi:hypothetical protein
MKICSKHEIWVKKYFPPSAHGRNNGLECAHRLAVAAKNARFFRYGSCVVIGPRADGMQ